jgi:tetratricopeptide (TPR) repeat protein
MNLRLVAICLAVAAPASAETPTEAAIALFKAHQYPEARAALEKITSAEPGNAAACYYLGQTLLRRNDPTGLDEAVKWLQKAAELEPTNATYLADYGGASMELSGKTMSIGAATRGRDAMEQSLKLNPDNLDAREGLMQFYQQAPWPFGSSAKAAVQLEEIRQRDPDRATVISVIAKANAKDYAGAFKLCEDVLAKTPDNYTALYQYGRTASLSGQNLERGLESMKKCLTLPLPGPSSPKPTGAWYRIGVIQEKLGHPAEARAAYEAALKLDAGNKPASDALAKLK